MEKNGWIAVDCRMVEHSGIGRYIQMVMPLLKSRFRITTLGDGEQLAKFEWFDSEEHIELKSNIYNPLEQLELFFRIPSADIFWSPHFTVPILPVKAKKRVVTVHDMYHLRHSSEFSGAALWYLRRLFKRVSTSDRIITVSEFSKSEIRELTATPADKIEVIHNGVDTSFFSEAINDEYRAELPSEYLLYVGNVKPHKNLKTLVRGFKRVVAENNDIKLVLAGKRDGFISGDPELRDMVEESEELSEKIVFTGFIQEEHLATLYAGARALIFPSVYEGFGLPPLEAMASGIPVAASDAASIPEVCGDAALYFDPHDDEVLAERIELILNDKEYADQLVNRGAERVKNFSWDISADKHLCLFTEILKSRREQD